MPISSAVRAWQDALLTISQRLPLQGDVLAIMRTLVAVCGPLFDFQRLTLCLAPSVTSPAQPLLCRAEHTVLYCIDRRQSSAEGSEYTFVPPCDGHSLWARSEVFCCDGRELERQYPHLAELAPYRQVQSCLHLPLLTQGAWRGSLQWLRTEGEPFSEEVATFCRVLAGVVGASLAALLHVQVVQREVEHVRRERDHFSILVDVTNTAVGTLEMDTMVHIVTREIRRYCGIHVFALLLLEGKPDAQTFTLHEILSKEYEDSPNPRVFPLAGSVLQRVLTRERPLSLSPGDRAHCEGDPVLSFVREQQCNAAYLFRLHLGNRLLGAMLLAHAHADIFTLASLRLLEQIADRVAIAVHNAQDYAALHGQRESLAEENLYLAEQVEDSFSTGDIIGKSAAIRHVLEQVDMVADSDSSVLLLGETGTGKELLALAIHHRSARGARRMIKMNCAAMPAGLLESELFGHEKGAFTGANTQRKGRFELAHGSTFLLDEVGDIPLELQPKLLRVLQSREIERIGGSRVIPVDVRLVAATNRNLQEMVNQGTFRGDLFYRLNVFPIMVPPLRERREDIPLLAQHYARTISQRMKKDITHIPAEAMNKLCSHDWPGNVRELANVIERAVILSSGASLNLCSLDASPPLSPPSPPPPPPPAKDMEENAETSITPTLVHPQPGEGPSERERIVAALVECNGVVAGPRGVAAKLGLKRTTLLSRMQRMGINVRDILGSQTH